MMPTCGAKIRVCGQSEVPAFKPWAPSYLEKTANSADRGHAMLSFFCMSFLISKEEISFEDMRIKGCCPI